MNSIAIQFENLGHAYRSGEWIFQQYAAQVPAGKVFALLGPNGCGKTTLLKILLGALTPSTGKCKVDGRVGFVPQIFQVSFDYTALEMVLMGRARQIGLFSSPTRRDREAALAAMERFGITHLASRPFHELSGGQRQLVIFARALVSEAQVLILDEPTSALDLKNQVLILNWIQRLSRQDGLTVFFTTHHPQHALAIADETMLMLEESKYASGPPAQVMSEANLQALYGVEMRQVAFDYRGVLVTTLVPVLVSSTAAGA